MAEEAKIAKRKTVKYQNNPQKQADEAMQALRSMPISLLLSILETTVSVLHERGIEVVDLEDKSRHLVQFRQLGGKCYFFAEKREE